MYANSKVFLFICFLVTLFSIDCAAKKGSKKEEDPKECEVCVATLEAIDKLIPSDKKSNKEAVEKAIGTHCTLSGFGN